jgi:hypothetical protein
MSKTRYNIRNFPEQDRTFKVKFDAALAKGDLEKAKKLCDGESRSMLRLNLLAKLAGTAGRIGQTNRALKLMDMFIAE